MMACDANYPQASRIFELKLRERQCVGDPSFSALSTPSSHPAVAPWRYDPLSIIQPNDPYDSPLCSHMRPNHRSCSSRAAGVANAPGATRWLYCIYSGKMHR